MLSHLLPKSTFCINALENVINHGKNWLEHFLYANCIEILAILLLTEAQLAFGLKKTLQKIFGILF